MNTDNINYLKNYLKVDKVTIFIKTWCGYSQRAMLLLQNKGITPLIVDIEDVKNKKIASLIYQYLEMYKNISRRTVPQIFFGREYIGGYTELVNYFDK